MTLFIKRRFIFLTLLCLSLPFSAHAAGKGELKIGVINIAKIMQQAPDAVNASEKLRAEFEPREKELKQKIKTLQDKKDKAMRDSMTLSQSERSKLEREVLTLERDLQREEADLREDFALKNREILQKLEMKVVGAMQEFAKKEKLDLMLAEG
ncbi:MAG: OmpH family outer membrane protein, partial [Gammaproteobacteria bacterium]|nr:OmpH family outer membrane protein [Gammaproteobacteria bacterium]